MHLGACGDWCLGGRIEGAFTAAYNLVETIKKIIP
jgi:predicted NAD/FAD-dependent oxidoreductase